MLPTAWQIESGWIKFDFLKKSYLCKLNQNELLYNSIIVFSAL
jgi:hypothetical protein